MQPKNATYIKGLSIAVIVVAALGLFASIVGFFMLGAIGSLAAGYGPDAVSMAHHHGYTHGLEYQYNMSDQAAWNMLAALGSAFGVIVALCHVVILVAGIIGLRLHASPERYGTIMGWSIAGAIVALIGGGFVAMVLLIIVAVLSYKGRAAAASQPSVAEQPPAPPAAAQSSASPSSTSQ